MRKKGKLLAAVLVLLAAAFVPAAGFAAEGDTGEHSGHDGWTAWTSTDGLPGDSGKYYLTEDVTLDVSDTAWLPGWRVGQEKTFTLCLNGHSICLAGGKQAPHSTIEIAPSGDGHSGGELTLCDCAKSGTITTNAFDQNSNIIQNHGILNLNDVTLTGNTAEVPGGGVYNAVGAFFAMNSGTITKNKTPGQNPQSTPWGQGAGVHNVGEFIMNGGTISENESGYPGGGIFNEGEFTMNGGVITKNEGLGFGGGVGNAGTMHMNGGKIVKNKAGSTNDNDGHGGGIFNRGTLGIYDGTISENTADHAGGGVYAYDGTFTIGSSTDSEDDCVTITGNTVGGADDNVYLGVPEGDGALQRKINISGDLAADTTVGVTTQNKPQAGKSDIVITNGLGILKGDEWKLGPFISDDKSFAVTRGTGADSEEAVLHIHGWVFDGFAWTGDAVKGYTKAEAHYSCEYVDEHKNIFDADFTSAVTAKATCTGPGKTAYTASVSAENSPDKSAHSETRTANLPGAMGHSWGPWKVVKEPTETEKGMKERVCRRNAGHVQRQSIPPLGPKPGPQPKKVQGIPLTKMTAKGKKSMVISWKKVAGADGYDIFFASCRNEAAPAKLAMTVGSSTRSWTKTGLKKKKPYKGFVKAFVMKKGKKTYVASSPMMHAYTSGWTKNYTNAKSVKVNKTGVRLKAGKTFRIKAKVKKLRKGKKLMHGGHVAKVRYLSTDPGVATVTKKGVIRGKAKGTCSVYVFAHNGVSKTIRVTVR